MRPTGFSTLRRSRAIPLALLLAGAALLLPAVARSAEEQGQKGQGKEYGPEANPGEVFKETKGRSALHSKGLTARQVHGKEAGKPLSSMPGAKPLTREAWGKMKDIPLTGLFLVELDHVPPGLEEDLKKNGYQLAADGTLTREGKPVALFVHGETFEVKPDKAAPGAQGMLDRAGEVLSQLAGSRVSEAEAATPFPWACVSWYFKWEYNGGFCRDYKAWSDAYSWGSGPGGGCGDPKPLTRIEYISTYVTVGSYNDWDYHYSADQSHSYARWDIGCFWPAHGGAAGYHYAYWRDGSASMYRTWSW